MSWKIGAIVSLKKVSMAIPSTLPHFGASQVVLVVLPANAGDIRDMGLIPGSGRFPGGQHGSSLQYPCLETPIDSGAWCATVHGVTESDMAEVT